MSGSKKGERRGNARRKGARMKPANRPHETPNEIMREAVSRRPDGRGDRGQGVRTIERRIFISRVILGDTGAVEDMTPKEVMLEAMHHNMQAVRDWKQMLLHLAQQPVTPETIAQVQHAEAEIERLYDKAGEHAFKVAPMIHPRLSAIALAPTQGDSPGSILQTLLDEIDERERDAPPLLEYQPKKGAA